MKQQNLILRAAVLAGLGTMAGQAGAQVDLTSPTAVNFAKELPITSTTTLTLTNSAGALDVRVPTVAGFGPSNSNPLYLKVHLSNGAKFATAPKVSCSGISGGSAAGEATSYTGSITFGGVGQSDVTFTITAIGAGAAATMTGGSGCVVSGFNVTVSGGLNNVNASATYEYTNGAVATVSGVSGSYISFARGYSAHVSASTGSLVVDAINGATRFSAGGAAISSASAILGTVATLSTSAAVFSANGTSKLSAGDVVTATTLTVSGPAIAAALANGSSGVYLSNTADCGTKDIVASDSASNSVTFSLTATNLTQLSAASGITMCANLSGNTTQVSTGQLTAVLAANGTGVTSVTADLTAVSNNIANVTQNGASMNAYFINASSSANKTSVLRLINTNSSTATFRGTAYDESGAVLGTASATLGTATANGMLTLTSAQLESALGFTPASGTSKYRVLITGNVSSFKAINFVKDVATGNLTLGQQQDN